MYQWNAYNPTKVREKTALFLHPGSSEETPESGQLRNNRHLFLTIPEAGHPWPCCPCGEVGALLWIHTSHCAPHGWKGEGSPWGPLLEGQWPHSGSIHFQDLISSQEAHLLIVSPWSLGLQHLSLGDTNRQTIAKTIPVSPQAKDTHAPCSDCPSPSP